MMWCRWCGAEIILAEQGMGCIGSNCGLMELFAGIPSANLLDVLDLVSGSNGKYEVEMISDRVSYMLTPIQDLTVRMK